MKSITKFFWSDFQSGIVVFLVALPLCLGIALASGAPLFSGIIAGVIGGIVVGFISNSQLSVSGPAAGLTAIVLTTITSLGGFPAFLCAVIIAGVIQILLGLLKSGTISNYFPSNVIEGMLSAIGIIIILKQIPHAFGYDKDSEGDMFFIEKDTGHNTFTGILDSLNYIQPGAFIITIISIIILVLYNKIEFLKKLKSVPGALIVVLLGILLNAFFKTFIPSLTISSEHLVSLPIPSSMNEFLNQLVFPNFSEILKWDVWLAGITIAIVASIETLLCIEACDKLDPMKRYTNTNTELIAQGVGNMLSGIIGGLPMTSVIVRSSANINSGAKTKMSTIIHGILLFVAVILIPGILNQIPLASLAAILIMIGFKLASPKVLLHMWHSGKYQFIPFIITILAVVFTDLLRGVAIGMVFSIFFILRANLKLAYFFKREEYQEGEFISIKLAQEVSFLNKAAIKQTLNHLPENGKVIIDASETFYIDHDVLQLIRDFLDFGSKDKNIQVTLKGFKEEYRMEQALDHVTTTNK